MKKLLSIITLCTIALAANAYANDNQNRTLVCRGRQTHNFFTANLDGSAFNPSSGFFQAKNADLHIQYATASDMACAGYTLDELSCVGYWFGQPDSIVKIDIKKVGNEVLADVVTLSGSFNANSKNHPWTCKVD